MNYPLKCENTINHYSIWEVKFLQFFTKGYDIFDLIHDM